MNWKAGVIFLLGPWLVFACSGSDSPGNTPAPGTGGADASVGGGAGTAGSAGAQTGGTAGSAGAQTGGTAGSANGGSAGAAGSAGTTNGGSGGTAGEAGASGQAGAAGGAGAAQASPECTDANQCTLLNDCCNCMPLAPGEQGPACNNTECFVLTCTPKGVTATACAAGQCVLEIDCDPSHVVCNGMPPACPKGEVPIVKNACWTGGCIKATYCPVAPSCSDCDTATSTCVVHETQMGQEAHCVDIPAACQGQVNCSCLGPAVCSAPWNTCSDSNPPGTSLHCSCPTC